MRANYEGDDVCAQWTSSVTNSDGVERERVAPLPVSSSVAKTQQQNCECSQILLVWEQTADPGEEMRPN